MPACLPWLPNRQTRIHQSAAPQLNGIAPRSPRFVPGRRGPPTAFPTGQLQPRSTYTPYAPTSDCLPRRSRPCEHLQGQLCHHSPPRQETAAYAAATRSSWPKFSLALASDGCRRLARAGHHLTRPRLLCGAILGGDVTCESGRTFNSNTPIPTVAAPITWRRLNMTASGVAPREPTKVGQVSIQYLIDFVRPPTFSRSCSGAICGSCSLHGDAVIFRGTRTHRILAATKLAPPFLRAATTPSTF